jgi:hypothetical protein
MYIWQSMVSWSISTWAPFWSPRSSSTRSRIDMGPGRTCFRIDSRICSHICSLCSRILGSFLSTPHTMGISYNWDFRSLACRFIPYTTPYGLSCNICYSGVFGMCCILAICSFCWNILGSYPMRIAWIVDFSAKTQKNHVSLSLTSSSKATSCKSPFFSPTACYNLIASILLSKNCLLEHQWKILNMISKTCVNSQKSGKVIGKTWGTLGIIFRMGLTIFQLTFWLTRAKYLLLRKLW